MTNEEAIEELKEEFEVFKSGISQTDWDNPDEELKKIIEANTMAIKALESQKHGKWILYSNIYKCPFCDYWFDSNYFDKIPNFCEDCGADMRGDNNAK